MQSENFLSLQNYSIELTVWFQWRKAKFTDVTTNDNMWLSTLVIK